MFENKLKGGIFYYFLCLFVGLMDIIFYLLYYFSYNKIKGGYIGLMVRYGYLIKRLRFKY